MEHGINVMQTKLTPKDGTNRISVGRGTPRAPWSGVGGRSGFTLTELLVVIATLALLSALILPVLSQGLNRDTSIKAQCANQLRQIGVAMTACAQDNNGIYLPARGGNAPSANTQALNRPQAIQSHFFAPNATNGADKIWCCPSLPDYAQPTGLPVYQASQGQWILGYKYYGGIQYWVNSVFTGGTPSYSPVTLSQAHPAWVLASDCISGYIGGGTGPGGAPLSWQVGNTLYGVPHRRVGAVLGGVPFPDGANECFVDGSVSWMKVESTLQLTEYLATYELDYMYQSELPPAFNALNISRLKWTRL
jgi:prepilin-type N-terminal cleavage/methylation domain-containing protein